MTKMPISEVPEVQINIEAYRDNVIFTDLGGRPIERPQGELHSIESFQTLFDDFSQLPALGTDQDWYVGVYPCIKTDKDGIQRLSFYFVPTIGAKGLTTPPGTRINTSQLTDYLQAVNGGVTPAQLGDIQNNIFDIGNLWP